MTKHKVGQHMLALLGENIALPGVITEANGNGYKIQWESMGEYSYPLSFVDAGTNNIVPDPKYNNLPDDLFTI